MDANNQQFIHVYVTKSKVNDLVTLTVSNYKFICSKKSLCKRSPYFRVMFTSNFIERDLDSVTIHDIDAEALKFILTRSHRNLRLIKEPLKVLQVASVLLFEPFVAACEHILLSKIKDRSLPIMCVSKKLNNTVLYDKARAISLWNFKNLKNSEGLFNMEYQDFFEYINDCDLYPVHEFDVFQCITAWVDYSLDNRSQHVFDLVQTVRYRFLEPYHLVIMQVAPVIRANNDAVNLLNVILKIINFIISESVDFNTALEAIMKSTDVEEKIHQAVLDVMSTTRPSPLIPCTICEFDGSTPCVVGFDDGRLKKMWDIPKLHSKKFMLNGFRVARVDFKVYFIGGEYGYGYGRFNFKIWSYDTMYKKWTVEGETEYPRRHFFVCTIKDDIFLIGGTGLHRVILTTIAKFNVVTGNSEDCGNFKNGKIEAVCSDSNTNQIYIATGEKIWVFYPSSGISKVLIFIPAGKIISSMAVYNNGIYFIDRSDKSVWNIVRPHSGGQQHEFVAKFAFHGDTLMVDRFLYCFSHGDDSCYMEQLDVESKELRITTGNYGCRVKHTNNCRGSTCFSYPFY